MFEAWQHDNVIDEMEREGSVMGDSVIAEVRLGIHQNVVSVKVVDS